MSIFNRTNFLLNKKRESKPHQVFMWFDPICNLKCKQCSIGRQCSAKIGGGFSYRNAEKIILKLNEWLDGQFTLNFLGGELFLYKKFLSLLKLSGKNGIRTSVTSNGSLINNLFSRKIATSGLSFIAISLDSVTPTIHDCQRGQTGLHRKVVKGIKSLITAVDEFDSTLKIYINSLIFKGNLEEVIPLVSFASNLGVDAITFQPIADPGFFGVEPENETWFKESNFWPEYEDVKKVIDELIQIKTKNKIIGNSLRDLNKFLDYFRDPLKFSKSYRCNAHRDSLVVTADGQLKLCPSMLSIGDVLKDDLDKVWNGYQSYLAREEVKKCNKQCKILSLYKEDFYF